MTELLTVGATAADSADFTIAADATAKLYLKGSASGGVRSRAFVLVQRKDSAGVYTTVGRLSQGMPGATLDGPFTGRLQRPALDADDAVGVDQE